MADRNKDRRRRVRHHIAAGNPQRCPSELRAKEYNYALHLSAADQQLLEQYREALVQGTTGFAEVYYNHLFDNPDIADVLYSHERSGGDIGMLIRSDLKCLLGCITSPQPASREDKLVAAGKACLERGCRPVWIIAAYHLLLDYLHDLLPALDMPAATRDSLESVLVKLLLRDLGLTLEGYWQTSRSELRVQMTHLAGKLGASEDLLSGIPLLLWSVDIRNSGIVYANYPLQSLYQGSLTAPFPCLADTAPDDQQPLLSAWQDAVSKGSSSCVEVRVSLAGAAQHWYRISLYPSLNRKGRPVLMHCVMEDINHEISERKQLEQMATTDRLTGLPNRALWADHLQLALAASRRVPGSQVVVISLDINQFQMYNDTLGRDVGDILLREVAERLDASVRESDSLARLGGDQFGILLQPVNSVRTATERVITQILDSFDIPFPHHDKQLCVGLTLGIACFPEDGTSGESLLANAESAMHRAKRNGLPYQYFDPMNDVSPADQLRYSGQIRNALDNNEFELHYQPQVDIQTNQITGAEALLRWTHPVEGMVMPQRIIPVAEQLGMITSLTDWVLITALQQCRQWSFDGTHIPVSVNVSARCFQNPRLLEKIQSALEAADVTGDHLEIEITEATLMQDVERATEVLNRLSDVGVTIAIDDFGTGYSSLSYLKRLPIHTLKIDQSFIMDVGFDPQDVAIVRSIIDLGHNLGYKVVAEGVENSKAWDMLDALGCDTAQGFHISRPLPEGHFSSWLAESDLSAG